jgi:hypothetical protein
MKNVNDANNNNCSIDDMLILLKKVMKNRGKDDVATRLECRVTENATRKEFALAYYSYSHEYE